MTTQHHNQAGPKSNWAVFWWTVIAVIIVAGLSYGVYRNTTPLPNVTTTAGTNTTGINAPEGNTQVSPAARGRTSP